MGFREFLSNFWYRRQVRDEFERFENLKPPANPSRKYIDKLVHRLLDEDERSFARKELEMIGAPAAPSLKAALEDARFREGEPLDLVLALLIPLEGDAVMQSAMKLIESPAEGTRKIAALHLATLGKAETLPEIAKLLEDTEGYVRSYTAMGIERAVSQARADADFRRGAYELLLRQCDQEWGTAMNDAAAMLVRIDPARAAADFASPRWLSCGARHLYRILDACNEAGIVLPERSILPVYESALAKAIGDRCYPYDSLAAEALTMLARGMGERAMPMLEAALGHARDRIQEAAGQGLATVAGIDDAVGFVLDRVKEVTYEGLTAHQRTVYLAFKFDVEVCNGGLAQLVCNCGELTDMLAALRELGHADAIAALEGTFKAIGPAAHDSDQDMRLLAFEEHGAELAELLGPLEGAYWRSAGRLRQMIQVFAAKHATDFRAS